MPIKPEKIKTKSLCDYGCGTKAKFKLSNGKYCCNSRFSKCSKFIKTMSKIKSSLSVKVKTKRLCSYGCGKQACYKMKNGKYCCSNHYSSCSKNKEKNSNALKGRKFSKEHKRRLSDSNKGRQYSEETKKKISDGNKGKHSGKDNYMFGKTGKDHHAFGKKYSEEHCKKISIGVKGKKRSVVQKRKMSKIRIAGMLSGKIKPQWGICEYIYNKYSLQDELMHSSYETKFATECTSRGINWTKIHPIIIDYVLPADGSIHSYLPDFLLCDYSIVVEIKPRYMMDEEVNLLKFSAAKKWAKENNYTYIILDLPEIEIFFDTFIEVFG